MSTIRVRPGEGTHYPMIDGDHVAKAAAQDAVGAFEVFEVFAHAARWRRRTSRSGAACR